MHRGHDAEHRQDYDLAVVEYTKALRAASPDDANARAALERAKLRASQDHFNRGRRLAATGKFDEALVEYRGRLRAEPDQRRHRPGAARDAQQAARQGRGRARGQDRAADADRARARPAAARPRPAGRRQDAGVAHLPRREQPRRLHRDRALRQHQPDLRPDVPRHAGHRRPAQHARSRTRSARSPARRARSSASPRRRRSSSSPTRRPSAASTRKRSSGRST